MKYQIGSFTLDTKTRTLIHAENVQNIRPKTLTLLLYLASREGQVISKQELLNCVWDDVNVDEGVIFQSVGEIRKLFVNPKIILNYPRRGYEFTESLVEINTVKPLKILEKISAFKVTLLVVALLVFFVIFYQTGLVENKKGYTQNIVVLPIKNSIPYAENNWIYLGGMEQLIAKLNGLPDTVFIHQGTYIPRLMHIAELSRNYDTNKVSNIFSSSGATLVVESQIYGASYDYKLVYKLHLPNDVKEGVILDNSIDGALDQLSNKIARLIGFPLERTADLPATEFSDALFAKAITSYESDWYSSISFFESFIALKPESIIARIYLAKLYLWDGKIAKAEATINQAGDIQTDDKDLVVHIQLIKALVFAKRLDWEKSMLHFDQAQQLTDSDTDLLLKIRILEERGRFHAAQGQIKQGLSAFNQALSYYKIIKSPVGINSTRLEMALLLYKQGDTEQAKLKLRTAEEEIEKIKLGFLYGMLEQYKHIIEQ